MEFISGESRDRIITLPDCTDDCITDGDSARAIEAHVNSLDMAALGGGWKRKADEIWSHCGRRAPSARIAKRRRSSGGKAGGVADDRIGVQRVI